MNRALVAKHVESGDANTQQGSWPVSPMERWLSRCHELTDGSLHARLGSCRRGEDERQVLLGFTGLPQCRLDVFGNARLLAVAFELDEHIGVHLWVEPHGPIGCAMRGLCRSGWLPELVKDRVCRWMTLPWVSLGVDSQRHGYQGRGSPDGSGVVEHDAADHFVDAHQRSAFLDGCC